MKLIDYMRQRGLDDAELAMLIGNCTAHAVKKWKYRERTPDPDVMFKIQSISEGLVTLQDWTRGSVEAGE